MNVSDVLWFAAGAMFLVSLILAPWKVVLFVTAAIELGILAVLIEMGDTG